MNHYGSKLADLHGLYMYVHIVRHYCIYLWKSMLTKLKEIHNGSTEAVSSTQVWKLALYFLQPNLWFTGVCMLELFCITFIFFPYKKIIDSLHKQLKLHADFQHLLNVHQLEKTHVYVVKIAKSTNSTPLDQF